MPLPAPARLLVAAALLVLAAAPRVVAAAAESLLIVEPDVELVLSRDDGALPSAERSEAVARRWPAAAAAALGLDGTAVGWRPPDAPRDAALDRAWTLQEAVSLALLEYDDPSRPLSIDDGAARIAVATGATHALFAHVRATPRRGGAVAMLVDLRSGAVLRHRVVDGVAADTAPERLADRLAADLLGDWRGDLPGLAPARPHGNDSARADAARADIARDDVARAADRLERRLRRHPRRVDDPSLDAALRAVACRVDADQCATLRPIVLAEPGAYAAILPGGAMVLHTGLLLRLHDEAELAFVLAHESAHERAGDVRARVAEGRAGARGETARAREAAADRDAFARLRAAGYDAAAAVDLWTRLAAEQAAAGGTTLPGSHPSAGERLAAARTAAAGLSGGDDGRERWAALAAPRRVRWLADEMESGDPAATAALLEHLPWTPAETSTETEPATATATAAVAPETPSHSNAPVHTLRVLGLRLPSRLAWRQRPGIGAVAWTVDGTSLNRLLIVSRVGRGDPLLHDASADASRWDDTSPTATTAAIAAALRGAGWSRVRTDAERPHDFGGHAGRRARLSLADASGSTYRGELAHVVRDGRLTWAVWMAPEGYYHERDAAEIAEMLDGMRFAR